MQGEQKTVKKRKTDRRSTYTKKLIMDAYIQLLKTTPKNKIKIAELCRIAEINRCTFYLHFEDIQSVENAIIEKLNLKFEEHLKTQRPNQKNRLLLSNNFIDAMLHDDTYITLMSTAQNQQPLLPRFVKDNYITNLKNALPPDSALSDEQLNLLYTFIVGGVIAVEQSWIQNDANVYEENRFLDQIVQTLLRQTPVLANMPSPTTIK